MHRIRSGEKRAFELANRDLRIRVGRLGLILTSRMGEEQGVIITDDREVNEELFYKLGLPYPPILTPADSREPLGGALLHPGEKVRIGRRIGAQIFDRKGNPDDKREEQYEWRSIESLLMSNSEVSREHAEIMALGDSIVEIKDLGSLNGIILPHLQKQV